MVGGDLPGWLVTSSATDSDVHVLGTAEIPAFIRRSPYALSHATVEAIARHLEHRCRDVEF